MDASPAQSLKLESRTTPPRAGPRCPRARWCSARSSRSIRRAALGASAAALLLLASTWYGVVKGGHYDDIVAQVQDICDTAANSAGFRISEVALAGNRELSRENILTLAGITGRSSLLFLDAAQDARAAA